MEWYFYGILYLIGSMLCVAIMSAINDFSLRIYFSKEFMLLTFFL